MSLKNEIADRKRRLNERLAASVPPDSQTEMRGEDRAHSCGCRLTNDSDGFSFRGLRWVYCPLHAAAPELLEVARIEQQLQMFGYTKASAKAIGPDAEDAYLTAGAPGLNDWRRRKREAAIAKAEGASSTRTTPPNPADQPNSTTKDS
jgi:hypothetical protein